MKERSRFTLICGFVVILVVIALCGWGAYTAGYTKGYGEGYNASIAEVDQSSDKPWYKFW
jgi:hypothetical protein